MTIPAAPVRVLVAGAGAFGGEHISRLARRADVRVVGVADPNSAALERIRSRYGVAHCVPDPLKMIDEAEADAIVVATPAASHVEIASRALDRDLCVLVEKPVATSASVAALLRSSRKSKAFVLPGHVLRFSQHHQRLVEIARSGRIGDIVYVNSRRYRDDSHAVRYADADPILTTLVHDIDLAQWVAGSDFRSVLARRTGGPGYRSLTALSAITASGVTCDLRTAWTFTDGNLPPDTLEAVGERGSVELAVGQGLRLYRSGRCDDLPLFGSDDPLSREHDHFLDCVRDRSREPKLGLPQALAGLKLADAALESLRLGREVFL